ncbi:LPXTG cell wall anchor domain-containing protein [Sphingomonas sp.]
MEARIIVALTLIAISGIGALAALAVYLPRRRREKLRRRGIKSSGH